MGVRVGLPEGVGHGGRVAQAGVELRVVVVVAAVELRVRVLGEVGLREALQPRRHPTHAHPQRQRRPAAAQTPVSLLAQRGQTRQLPAPAAAVVEVVVVEVVTSAAFAQIRAASRGTHRHPLASSSSSSSAGQRRQRPPQPEGLVLHVHADALG